MNTKKLLSVFLACLLVFSIALPTAWAEKETVAGGYEIDMEDLPKVHFADHPEWEELFDATWQMHKSNIQKIPAATNPEQPYYVDEAFSGNIFAWDTCFMMLYDKYGVHQFPNLTSLDNFYYNQTDKPGETDDGYIPREIIESTGKDYHNGYTDERSMNPPLWAWAEWEQYQIHGDVSRFSKVIKGKTIFERLISHYNFIERYKKLDNGLYGKTNGLGNGLDNTPNQGSGQTYNDLSIQQAQFAYGISLIAAEMGNTEQAAFFDSEYRRISALINEKLWSEEKQMYSNLAADGATKTNISTPTNLWSLVGRVATPERAQQIIQAHGLNSQQLFRPNGLATASYSDYTGFRAEGGYWLGAIWAPTSYQYIKGLSEYGYTDLAFEEALRHLNTVSTVYEEGKKAGYVTRPTIWENYSSEYVRNGYTGSGASSRPNFAGWTGAIVIATIIEDVLGVNISAPRNTIEWDVRLQEEHGVSNLYMNHNGEANRVSLLAEQRASGDAPLRFKVTATKAFTLVVKNGTYTQSFDIQPGTHSYTLSGREGGAQGYLGAVAKPFDSSQVSKQVWEETAKDYVVFGSEKDASVQDGLQYRTGKNAGLIYNVNTVGYPTQTGVNPIALRDSGDMQAVGFTGAQEVAKSLSSFGPEGFMMMAPAANSLQTMRLVIGVKNGKGSVTATLSDASDQKVIQTLQGGEEESVYVVDIPFRAASNDRHLLVKWTADQSSGGKTAEVSLKGIALLEGGNQVPRVPVDFTAVGGDGQITVNAKPAKSDKYDSWKISLVNGKNAPEEWTIDSLPFTITGLENFKEYHISVAGVISGQAGPAAEPQRVIPEAKRTNDYERAEYDLFSTAAEIRNGNDLVEVISHDFNLSVKGKLYGSDFTLSSDTDGKSFGVMNDGSVRPPLMGMQPVVTELVLTSRYNGVSYTLPFMAKVPPVSPAEGYVLGSTNTKYTGNVYLTREGSKDWMQIRSDIGSGAQQARKATGSGIENLIRVHDAVPGGQTGMMTDASLYYVADDAGSIPPTNQTGSHMRGEGNYLQFDVAYSEKNQHVNVYCGVWYAEARVDFLVNDVVISSETVSAAALRQFRVGFDFKLASPSDKASVRLTLVDMSVVPDNSNGSAYLNAITLSESAAATHWIPAVPAPQPVEMIKTTQSFTGAVNLTEQGSNDWMQLQADSETNYSRKAGGHGLYEFKRNHTAVPSGEKGRVTDGNITYTYTDASDSYPKPINRSGMQTRGEGNGLEFKVGYSDVVQTLNVYTGVWSAQAKVEFIVNGETIYSQNISQSGSMGIFRTTIDYKLDNPDDVAIFRLTLLKMSGYGSNNGSTFLFAAALGNKVLPESIGTVIQATDYLYKNDAENPNIENGGQTGKNIGGVNAGSWLSYPIQVEKTGVYDLTLVYAAASQTDPDLTILVDDRPVGKLTSILPTGGWQSWKNITTQIPISAGHHILKLAYGNAGTNLDSFGLKLSAEGAVFEAPENALKNEAFVVTMHLPKNALKLMVQNSEGRKIGISILEKQFNEDGSVTVSASMSLGTAGSNRVLQVYDGTAQLGQFSLDILTVQSDIYDLGSEYLVRRNEVFQVQVITSKDLIKGKFYNENGGVIGSTCVLKENMGDYTLRVYEMQVGTAGDLRTLTFKADYDKKSDFPFSWEFYLKVLPADE